MVCLYIYHNRNTIYCTIHYENLALFLHKILTIYYLELGGVIIYDVASMVVCLICSCGKWSIRSPLIPSMV